MEKSDARKRRKNNEEAACPDAVPAHGDGDITSLVTLMGAQLFGESVLASGVSASEAQGYSVGNAVLHTAEYVDGKLILVYSMDVDYSPVGVDLQATVCQKQVYFMLGNAGTYCFTLSAANLEDLERMTNDYINTVVFK